MFVGEIGIVYCIILLFIRLSCWQGRTVSFPVTQGVYVITALIAFVIIFLLKEFLGESEILRIIYLRWE